MYATTREDDSSGHTRLPAFVVEDDMSMLRLLTEVADSVGLEPLAFTRLSTARRALRERVPAVLLVDDGLPDGRGGDFAREIRADPRTHHVKVIVCTSADAARRRQLAELAPVIAKPFEISEVEGVLRGVTGH